MHLGFCGEFHTKKKTRKCLPPVPQFFFSNQSHLKLGFLNSSNSCSWKKMVSLGFGTLLPMPLRNFPGMAL
jgi:hypothetical protein